MHKSRGNKTHVFNYQYLDQQMHLKVKKITNYLEDRRAKSKQVFCVRCVLGMTCARGLWW